MPSPCTFEHRDSFGVFRTATVRVTLVEGEKSIVISAINGDVTNKTGLHEFAAAAADHFGATSGRIQL